MSNSVRPHRRQPTRLPHPWDSPCKNTGVGCHFLLQRVKVKSLSHVRLFGTPWTAAHQAPSPMGFSRQEYWSGVPSPHLGVCISIDVYVCVYVCQCLQLTFKWIGKKYVSHHFMGNRWGNSGNSVRLYFSGLQNYCRWGLQP